MRVYIDRMQVWYVFNWIECLYLFVFIKLQQSYKKFDDYFKNVILLADIILSNLLDVVQMYDSNK